MKTTDQNNVPHLLKVIHELNRTRVEVGVFAAEGDFILMIANVHEYGVQIEVTDKMRKWFAWQGYPLRKDTAHINIPERSYIRAGFDENKAALEKKVNELLPQVIALEIPPDVLYEAIGIEGMGLIQKYMTDLKEPPNAQMTIDRKGSSNPLIDEGRLRQAISWRVSTG
jgi:hypothetical protein